MRAAEYGVLDTGCSGQLQIASFVSKDLGPCFPPPLGEVLEKRFQMCGADVSFCATIQA